MRAVLWDADGVLQDVPRGWERSMRPAIGHLVPDVAAFLEAAFIAERPTLRGEGSWVEVLGLLLQEWGIPEAYDECLRVWLSIETHEPAWQLVRAVREGGVACHLATNQDCTRGQFMQRDLGYGDLMDRCFYSHRLGVAKPAAGFFEAILAAIDLGVGEVLFVDDNAANVQTATSMGLRSLCWTISDGMSPLRSWLTAQSVLVS